MRPPRLPLLPRLIDFLAQLRLGAELLHLGLCTRLLGEYLGDLVEAGAVAADWGDLSVWFFGRAESDERGKMLPLITPEALGSMAIAAVYSAQVSEEVKSHFSSPVPQ